MLCFIHLSEQAQAIDGTTDIFLCEYLAAKYLLVNKSCDLLCVIVNESVHLCVCERERDGVCSQRSGAQLHFINAKHRNMRADLHTVDRKPKQQ